MTDENARLRAEIARLNHENQRLTIRCAGIMLAIASFRRDFVSVLNSSSRLCEVVEAYAHHLATEQDVNSAMTRLAERIEQCENSAAIAAECIKASKKQDPQK